MPLPNLFMPSLYVNYALRKTMFFASIFAHLFPLSRKSFRGTYLGYVSRICYFRVGKWFFKENRGKRPFSQGMHDIFLKMWVGVHMKPIFRSLFLKNVHFCRGETRFLRLFFFENFFWIKKIFKWTNVVLNACYYYHDIFFIWFTLDAYSFDGKNYLIINYKQK